MNMSLNSLWGNISHKWMNWFPIPTMFAWFNSSSGRLCLYAEKIWTPTKKVVKVLVVKILWTSLGNLWKYVIWLKLENGVQGTFKQKCKSYYKPCTFVKKRLWTALKQQVMFHWHLIHTRIFMINQPAIFLKLTQIFQN